MDSKLRTIDLTLASMFVALMAVGANPFMVVDGVPITLQTFFAILTGLVLGRRLGTIATTVYACVGPVFAQIGGGLGTLNKPTFGFILSHSLCAYMAGKIVEKNKSVTAFITASLIGIAINYVLGTNWMYYAYKFWADSPEGFTYSMAWMWMIVPLPKDIILELI